MPSDRPTRSRRDDLAIVCALGPERLTAALRAIQAMKPTIKRLVLRRTIASSIGDNPAEALEGILFNLALGQRRTPPYDGETVLANFDANFATVALSEKDRLAWVQCRPIIGQILLSPNVQIVAKATDLAIDFSCLCIANRIITDVRPIFDEERNNIVGTAITQTLRMDYTTPSGDESTISIALDERDIKALFNSCKDALAKAEKSRKMIEESGRETIMFGEDEYDRH